MITKETIETARRNLERDRQRQVQEERGRAKDRLVHLLAIDDTRSVAETALAYELLDEVPKDLLKKGADQLMVSAREYHTYLDEWKRGYILEEARRIYEFLGLGKLERKAQLEIEHDQVNRGHDDYISRLDWNVSDKDRAALKEYEDHLSHLRSQLDQLER